MHCRLYLVPSLNDRVLSLLKYKGIAGSSYRGSEEYYALLPFHVLGVHSYTINIRKQYF